MKVGETGSAVTTLRPGGQARIGDRYVDVIAQGWIEAGRDVRVVEVRGNRVVVEEV